MSDKHSLETHYKIYNDRTGDSILVKPDSDGHDMIEMQQLADDGTVFARITCNEDNAQLLIEALSKALHDLKTTLENRK